MLGWDEGVGFVYVVPWMGDVRRRVRWRKKMLAAEIRVRQ